MATSPGVYPSRWRSTTTARCSGGSAASAASTVRSTGSERLATGDALVELALLRGASAHGRRRSRGSRRSDGATDRTVGDGRSGRGCGSPARNASCAMSSASAASCTTRYAARWARGQYARNSASRSEADPRWAPRTQARSSRPAPATAGPYGRETGRGPRTGLRNAAGERSRDLAAPERRIECMKRRDLPRAAALATGRRPRPRARRADRRRLRRSRYGGSRVARRCRRPGHGPDRRADPDSRGPAQHREHAVRVRGRRTHGRRSREPAGYDEAHGPLNAPGVRRAAVHGHPPERTTCLRDGLGSSRPGGDRSRVRRCRPSCPAPGAGPAPLARRRRPRPLDSARYDGRAGRRSRSRRSAPAGPASHVRDAVSRPRRGDGAGRATRVGHLRRARSDRHLPARGRGTASPFRQTLRLSTSCFTERHAYVASGVDGVVRLHRLDGTRVRTTRIPRGSYNVSYGSPDMPRGRPAAVTPSLDRGTLCVLSPGATVRSTRVVARSAHDACVTGVALSGTDGASAGVRTHTRRRSSG